MWLKFGKLWVTLGKFLAYRKTKATISDIAAKVLNDSKGKTELISAVRKSAGGKPQIIELSNGQKVIVQC